MGWGGGWGDIQATMLNSGNLSVALVKGALRNLKTCERHDVSSKLLFGFPKSANLLRFPSVTAD